MKEDNGYIEVMRRSDWTAYWGSLDPWMVGLRSGTLLGIDVIWQYWDSVRDELWWESHVPPTVREAMDLERDWSGANFMLYVMENDSLRVVLGEAPHRRMKVIDGYVYEQELLERIARCETKPEVLSEGIKLSQAQEWFSEHSEEIEVW